MVLEYVGVDLGCSAMSRRPSSAVAVLNDGGKLIGEPVHFATVRDLLQVLGERPHDQLIIAVDAPRSVPDHTQENYSTRSCELEIKRRLDRHAGVFAGVASLYLRWFEIETAYFADCRVIETYPRVVWKKLGFPGKPKEFAKHRSVICSRLSKLVGYICDGFSHHQVDAALCAYTAYCYARDNVDWFGQPGEGLIITPAGDERRALPRAAEDVESYLQYFACMQRSPHLGKS